MAWILLHLSASLEISLWVREMVKIQKYKYLHFKSCKFDSINKIYKYLHIHVFQFSVYSHLHTISTSNSMCGAKVWVAAIPIQSKCYLIRREYPAGISKRYKFPIWQLYDSETRPDDGWRSSGNLTCHF